MARSVRHAIASDWVKPVRKGSAWQLVRATVCRCSDLPDADPVEGKHEECESAQRGACVVRRERKRVRESKRKR